MKLFKILLFILYIFLQFSCEKQASPDLPVIRLETEDKFFTYTNIGTGYYIGCTHSENTDEQHGWIVNDVNYLMDYQLFINDTPLPRDSVIEVSFYPHQILRRYNNGLQETFTMVDSINALIWEFEFQEPTANFSFKPVFISDFSHNQFLNSENLTLTISHSDSLWENILYPGFAFHRLDDVRYIVIYTLGSEKSHITTNLQFLFDNYRLLVGQRADRINRFLNRNNLLTNFPEITEAVTWSQISLEALLSVKNIHDIRTGIPGQGNYNSRDIFISLSGLLFSGKFDRVHEILQSYINYQNTNSNDNWYGRIPDHLTKQGVNYNSADVTWWYIRAVYEYLMYSGDMDFAREIFPVIRHAIEGALSYRIDYNFFLLHEDTETWMNASGANGPWSNRGNRAVEIQALWYTGLQIGARLALLNDKKNFYEHWLAISHTLRRNFTAHFWNDFKFQMYDHLNADNSKDRQIRPNQIFTLSVPDLPGIEPLISADIQSRVTNEVVQKLTYGYGVSSLWQGDKDFQPLYNQLTPHDQTNNYHNGVIWTWLSGPVISGLLKSGYVNLSFDLYLNQARQILDNHAIGNYSQFIDVRPNQGENEPPTAGALSYTPSLAEFSKNMYQNYIGFMPNALVDVATFKPMLPSEINYISARLPMDSGAIEVTFEKTDEGTSFNFDVKDMQDAINIIIDYAGYDIQYLNLSADEDETEIYYMDGYRRSYKKHMELDWYFARPDGFGD